MWLATASRSPSRSARAVQPRHLGEHGVVELPAGRQHAHDLLRVVAEPLDPQRQRRGQARRHGAAAVEPGGEQLLGEQRVALAAGVQPLDQRRVGRRAEDARELLAQLVAGEPGEVDPQRPGALELGEQRPQRVAAVQLVGPVGRDHQQRLGAQRGGEEAQERARRGVRPVQVLDHQQDGRGARQPVEHGEQRLEHARLVARAAHALARRRRGRAAASPARRGSSSGSSVEHRVAVAHERPQRGDERRVGQLALAQLDAVAAQHARAVRGGAAPAARRRAGSCRRRTRRRRTPATAAPAAASASAACSWASSRERPTSRLT